MNNNNKFPDKNEINLFDPNNPRNQLFKSFGNPILNNPNPVEDIPRQRSQNVNSRINDYMFYNNQRDVKLEPRELSDNKFSNNKFNDNKFSNNKFNDSKFSDNKFNNNNYITPRPNISMPNPLFKQSNGLNPLFDRIPTTDTFNIDNTKN